MNVTLKKKTDILDKNLVRMGYSDFRDRSYYKEKAFLAAANTVKITMYIQDSEVTNPLSRKAGTSIVNVPPKYRSTNSYVFSHVVQLQ